MELIKKYPWIFLAVIAVFAFLLGSLISGGPDKELIHKFETEREVHRQEIERRDARIKALDQAGRTIREKAIEDSVRFSEALKAKDKRIRTLTRQLENINLSMATDSQLDSIITGLYPD